MAIAAISIAWLSMDPLNTRARSTVDRTWDWLASTDEWSAWLREHVPDDLFALVNFEDRDKARTLVRHGKRGPSLTYYVPYRDLVAAYEAHTLESFAAEIYRGLYAAWARRMELPDPPRFDDSDLPTAASRLP